MSRHSSFHSDTTIFNLLSEVLGDEAKDSLGAARIPWWQLLGDNSHVKGFLHPQYRSETEQSELGPRSCHQGIRAAPKESFASSPRTSLSKLKIVVSL